jgi:hypothetical protein
MELKATGTVVPSVGRPKGFHVWNANALARITPFGYVYRARVGIGADTFFERFPQSWGDPTVPIGPIRIAGARGGTFTGQVGVSSDRAIRGLSATPSELVQKGGAGKIPATAVQALFTTFPEEPYNSPFSESIQYIDALYEKPPGEVAARSSAQAKFWAELRDRGRGITTRVDPGATAAVWIKVRVPADAPAGEYGGTLTVSADGAKPVSVPVALRVADWVVPEPSEWTANVGTPHSPDTLAIHYKVPLWSEEHWKLVEKTMAHMGEVGNKAIYLPLKANTCWFRNEESLVYFVKQPGGAFKYDYRVFDRYMDLVQKYMKPEVYCLYAVDFAKKDPATAYTAVGSGGGGRKLVKGPEYKPTPEALAVWKSLLNDVTGRLAKRGVKRESMMIGLAWEGGGTVGESVNDKVALFEKVIPPGMKQVQLAHFGGVAKRKGAGDEVPIPFGYVMSVFGNCGKVKSTGFGSKNIPTNVVQHYRAGGEEDVRPTAPRGFMRLCVEHAMKSTRGVGPLGMDFWFVPSDPAKGRKWHGGIPRPIEGDASPNLSMSRQSSGVFLAPGPDGPVSTARFEMFREGLQECEARMLLEEAMKGGRLNPALLKRCETVLAERERAVGLAVSKARGYGFGEGWKWYEMSDWEGRAYDLFACAGAVSAALGK